MNSPAAGREERRVRLIWLTLASISFAGALARTAIGPLLGPLMGEFRLSHSEAGLLAASFFYTYTLMQVPAGYLCDRLGQGRILLAATSLWAVATFATGFAGGFASLVFFRLLAGLGQGGYFPATRSLIGIIAVRRAALGQGVIGATGGLGMWMGLAGVGFIADHLGWRWTFLLISLPSFGGAFLARRFLSLASPPPPQSSGTTLRSVLGALRRRDLILMGLAGYSVVYASRVVDSWGPLMFQEIGVESLTRASFLAGLFGMGPAPSSLALGLLSDSLVRRGWGRKGLILAVLCIQTLLLGLATWALMGGGSAGLLALSLFLLGLTRGYWAPFTALFTEVVPPEGRATLLGVANAFWMTAAIVAPWLTGWLHDLTGSFVAGVGVALGLGVASTLFFVAFKPAAGAAPPAR